MAKRERRDVSERTNPRRYKFQSGTHLPRFGQRTVSFRPRRDAKTRCGHSLDLPVYQYEEFHRRVHTEESWDCDNASQFFPSFSPPVLLCERKFRNCKDSPSPLKLLPKTMYNDTMRCKSREAHSLNSFFLVHMHTALC